jgi:phosphotransferase system enzyme I (PtsP)
MAFSCWLRWSRGRAGPGTVPDGGCGTPPIHSLRRRGERQKTMLDRLRAIIQEVNAAPSLDAALALIVRRVSAAMRTEVCSVYLREPETGALVMMANQGLAVRPPGATRLGPGEGLVSLVALREEPLNLDRAQDHPAYHAVPELQEEGFNAFLGVPIIHQRRVLGVLVVQQARERRFDDNEEAFLVTLSAQLAGVVAHAQALGSMDASGLFGVDRPDAVFHGLPGVDGVAVGRAVVLFPPADLGAVPDRPAEDVTVELLLIDRALEAARADIRALGDQLRDRLDAEERALFDVYLHMLGDDALAGEIRERIREGHWAQGALRQVIAEHVARFDLMESSYLRERGADVRELGQRVLGYLQEAVAPRQHFPERTVLVSEEVTAGMLGDVPRDRLAGIVSTRGSSTSHVAILARALGVPTVMGAVDLPVAPLQNREVFVNGTAGEVVVNPSRAMRDHVATLLEAERALSEELSEDLHRPCETLDHHRVQLWVNVGLAEDLESALELGAEGIGLYRTEVPFIKREQFPTEDEQRALYREHLERFAPRPVTMRTLDIGGDKALSYFPIEEDNPFLGWRGIRVTLDHPEIFLVQVRAMLRASEGLGAALRIMLPMVTGVDEIDEASALIRRCWHELREEGLDVAAPLIGAMIEVPAAVSQARQFARRCDFLSVGSNDLTQYMLAVDRNNPRVAGLYRQLHPSVLFALQYIADCTHQEGKRLGICGEMAGTAEGALLLIGMGYDMLSMSAANLARIKAIVRRVRMTDARDLARRALELEHTDAVTCMVEAFLEERGLARLARGGAGALRS